MPVACGSSPGHAVRRMRSSSGEYRIGRAPDAVGDYEAEWDVLRSTGLDGVFVDHADLGVAFFRA